MENSSEQSKIKMNNGNGNNKTQETDETKLLKSLLQKAVNAEKAPDSLRDKISKRFVKNDSCPQKIF